MMGRIVEYSLEFAFGLLEQDGIVGVTALHVPEDGAQVGGADGRVLRAANLVRVLDADRPVQLDGVTPDQLEVERLVGHLQVGRLQQTVQRLDGGVEVAVDLLDLRLCQAVQHALCWKQNTNDKIRIQKPKVSGEFECINRLKFEFQISRSAERCKYNNNTRENSLESFGWTSFGGEIKVTDSKFQFSQVVLRYSLIRWKNTIEERRLKFNKP